MIARWWNTTIIAERAAEYDAFAETHSRPMFASLPGCVGALFLGTGAERSVISLWSSRAAIEALTTSRPYIETVQRLQATGVLLSHQSVQLLEVTGGILGGASLLPHCEAEADEGQ